MLALVVPNVSQVTARFILQVMVEEKENRIRETLKLMSVTRLSYASSFLFFQAFIAVF